MEHAAELRRVLAAGKAFVGGRRLISPEEFRAATANCRRGLFAGAPNGRTKRALDALDGLDGALSKAPLMRGKALVRPSELETLVASLEEALRAAAPEK